MAGRRVARALCETIAAAVLLLPCGGGRAHYFSLPEDAGHDGDAERDGEGEPDGDGDTPALTTWSPGRTGAPS